MIAMIALALLAAFVAITWRHRSGGLLPLALVVTLLSPIALVGWLSAEWSRWWLARRWRVKRSLETVGLGEISRGRSITVQRISRGRMNAVLLVTLTRVGEAQQQLVLKHLLRFGTLLGWVARTFGATCEYPPASGSNARTIREAHSLKWLSQHGLPAPQYLGCSVRHRLVAMEYVQGAEFGPQLYRKPGLVTDLGRLLQRMHAIGYSMGDANPENMLVDVKGQIVPFDFEQSHFGDEATFAKKGFDLVWAAAFLATDEDRARFFAAYGKRSPALEQAIERARAHLLRFAPIVEWYGSRWRGEVNVLVMSRRHRDGRMLPDRTHHPLQFQLWVLLRALDEPIGH